MRIPPYSPRMYTFDDVGQPCDKKSDAVSRWELCARSQPHWQTIKCNTRAQAADVSIQLQAAFADGYRQAMEDIRSLIGAK